MGASESDRQFVHNGINLRVLAKRQRQIIWLIGASLLLFLVEFPLQALMRGFMVSIIVAWTLVILYWSVQLLVIAGTLLLARALGTRWFLMPILGVLMLMPLINLIVLLLENNKATSRLKKAGLDVGFWGVSDEMIVQRLSVDLCSKCGYNLTGNVSGICPECGQVIRGREPSRLVEEPAA